jgi:hypothetical protein
MRLLRFRYSVKVAGSSNVAPGPAILVGNHIAAMDPVAAVIKHWWRVTAFAKVEVFENRGAAFFRWMGQIPLRRGDETSTKWALNMAALTLADGNKLGLYPVFQNSPDTPVHAITTTYSGIKRFRHRVTVHISSRLPIDVHNMTPNEIVDVIKNALLEAGGMPYVDAFARDLKSQAALST